MLRCHACLVRFEARFEYGEELMEKKEIPVFDCNMSFPTKGQIEKIRKDYPAGTKVRLLEMSDDQAPPAGTIGEIYGVDDIGSLLVHWSNGSDLNVLYGIDRVERVQCFYLVDKGRHLC